MTDLTWTPATARLDSLELWQHNPKWMPEARAKRLLKSWGDLNQYQTIACGPNGEVYDGNQRVKVLNSAGYPGDYEVHVLRSNRLLTDAERRRVILESTVGTVGALDWQDLAGWDDALLRDAGLDAEALALWNDDAANLAKLLEAEAPTPPGDSEPQIDRAEELREKWRVEVGQMWACGEHRVICGDCTDRAVVERVMGGEFFDTVIFDPEWDKMPDAILAQNALVFCDGATLNAVIDRYGAPTWIFVWDCVSCWYVPNRPLRRIKLCAWYGDIDSYNFDGWHYGDAGEIRTVTNTRGTYQFKPDPRGKHLSDLYSNPITKLHADSEHSHSKPVDWITLLIANCTDGIVFDPFIGSGTTLIACQNLGRKCLGIEISPAYVAVTLQRFLDHTGIEPVLIDQCPPKA